jgi:hypothetical protein
MEHTERLGVLDSGCDGGHKRGTVRFSLLANKLRTHKHSGSLPSCTTATPQSSEPLGPRAVAWPGPALLTVSTRPTMPYRNAVPAQRPRLARGIYLKLCSGHRSFVAVDSRGEELPFCGEPVGCETQLGVIARLADCLDAADPIEEWNDPLPPSFGLTVVRGVDRPAELPASAPPPLALVSNERPRSLSG